MCNVKITVMMGVVAVLVLLGGAVDAQAEVVTVDELYDWVSAPYLITCLHLNGDFDLDDSPASNVYAVILSEVDSQLELNGIGKPNVGGDEFSFYTFGDSDQDFTPVFDIYFIIDNGDENLFDFTGGTLIFFDDDAVLGSESASINGGSLGVLSDIFFSSIDGVNFLDSVSVVTPEPATMSLLVLGGMGMILRKRRQGSCR